MKVHGTGFQGKKNIYICRKCRAALVTVDRDDGTTPFLTGCVVEGCGGIAESEKYAVSQEIEPTHEWYRARDDALLLRHPAAMFHHRGGGLFLRPILKSASS